MIGVQSLQCFPHPRLDVLIGCYNVFLIFLSLTSICSCLGVAMLGDILLVAPTCGGYFANLYCKVTKRAFKWVGDFKVYWLLVLSCHSISFSFRSLLEIPGTLRSWIVVFRLFRCGRVNGLKDVCLKHCTFHPTCNLLFSSTFFHSWSINIYGHTG